MKNLSILDHLCLFSKGNKAIQKAKAKNDINKDIEKAQKKVKGAYKDKKD